MRIVKRLAARNDSARSERPVVIACLGDSVTHGCFDLFVDEKGDFEPHYMPDHGYVAKVGRKINELFPAAAVTMLNAGISGDGSKGGLERLERDVLCFKPDLVIVNFGLNDSMGGDEGVAAYAANMTEIFRRVLESGAEALLVTPNFMCSYVPYTVVGENLTNQIGIGDVAVIEDAALGEFNAAVDQGVKNNRRMSGLDKGGTGGGADVSGAAGNQNLHDGILLT